MKYKTVIMTGALLLGLNAIAAAQSSVIAAWDYSQYAFDGFSSVDGSSLAGSVNANYTGFEVDDGSGFATSGANYVGAAQFGTMYYDGQFGSSAFSLDPSDVEPNGGINLTAGNQVIPGATLGSNGAMNVLEGQGQPFTNNKGFGFNSGANGKAFTFGIQLTGDAAFQLGKDWVFQFGAKTFNDDGSSISWEYSPDGENFFDTGVTSEITENESFFDIDLTGEGMLDGVSSVYLRGTLDGVDSGLTSLDNFSAMATVPEPSTYAAVFGILVLGVAGWSRRRK